jgi:hypothetical protein
MGVVLLFFLASSDSGFIFLLNDRLVSRADECCEKYLPGKSELRPSDPPSSAELVATAPPPAVTSALWRGRIRSGLLLGVAEKVLDRGPPEAGFPPAKLLTGPLLFFDFFVQLSAIWPSFLQ